jgi:hypothetical protein
MNEIYERYLEGKKARERARQALDIRCYLYDIIKALKESQGP